MKKTKVKILTFILIVFTLSILMLTQCAVPGVKPVTDGDPRPTQGESLNYVQTDNTQFVLDGDAFYYNGANCYYLFYATEAEIDEVFDDAASIGLTVIRTWGFCDGAEKDGHAFQSSPGVYEQSGFDNMDYIIDKAEEKGIKLIIPFVNYWTDFGGMQQYVTWSATASTRDDFYTDTNTKAWYQNYVEYFLNYTNSITGRKYKDEPAIMMWELANEPICESDTSGNTLQNWIVEMAAFVKSIDSNHLLSTGSEGYYMTGPKSGWSESENWLFDGTKGVDYIRNHSIDDIDVASFHLYPDSSHFDLSESESLEWIEDHIKDAHDPSKIGKPVCFGEFGWKYVNRVDLDWEEDRVRVYTDWYDKCDELNADVAVVWQIQEKHLPDSERFDIQIPGDTSTCALIQDFSTTQNSKNGLAMPQSMNVEQGMLTIATDTGNYHFGDVTPGSSNTAIFTIQNYGDTDLAITGFSLTAGDIGVFSFDNTSDTSPVSGKSNTTFSISYDPTTDGYYSATVEIINDDSDKNPYSFTITGYTGQALDPRYEAEYAVTSEGAGTSYPDYSGTGYIGNFSGANDYCEFTIHVRTSGTYDITFGYLIPSSYSGTHKIQNLYVNGSYLKKVDFPESVATEWRTLTETNISLEAGDNTIKILEDWGYMFIDYIDVN